MLTVTPQEDFESIFSDRVGDGTQITALAITNEKDTADTVRVAAASSNGAITVFTLSHEGNVVPLLLKDLAPLRPSSMEFGPEGNHLYITGFDDGSLYECLSSITRS
jgi:hypothetical protein